MSYNIEEIEKSVNTFAITLTKIEELSNAFENTKKELDGIKIATQQLKEERKNLNEIYEQLQEKLQTLLQSVNNQFREEIKVILNEERDARKVFETNLNNKIIESKEEVTNTIKDLKAELTKERNIADKNSKEVFNKTKQLFYITIALAVLITIIVITLNFI